MIEKERRWFQFLNQIAADHQVGGEGGDGGDTKRTGVEEHLQTQTLHGQAVQEALKKLENEIADSSYFKSAMASGSLKRCPNCSRLIEKLSGCDSMKCGDDAHGGNKQSGCGHDFSWVSVPTISEQICTEIPLIGFNTSDPQIDFSSSSAIVCSSCAEEIVGTMFQCIRCSGSKSKCLSCLRESLAEISTNTQDHTGRVYIITIYTIPFSLLSLFSFVFFFL